MADQILHNQFIGVGCVLIIIAIPTTFVLKMLGMTKDWKITQSKFPLKSTFNLPPAYIVISYA